MEIFGDKVHLIDNQQVARFPKNIWKKVKWNNQMIEIAKLALEQKVEIMHMQLNDPKCVLYEVLLLMNVNTTTNEIMRYTITQERKDEILRGLIMLISTDS